MAIAHGALVWGIKASLLAYVRGMPDGAVAASGGALETPGGFRFPAVGPLAFAGAVTLTGHHGMLRIVVADPSIVEAAAGWALEIADPDAPAGRLRFAALECFDGASASGAALTEDGADLFFGPYEAGTPLDIPRLERD
ncbi:HtaA domain-containing protein [Agrococcus sp. 1P02AA]|uniref:HtaA domain-containing protein n=1 Tax=Agrococcus sp. 1P02AA TaxID=3132259 RepID=UPI0039A58627